MGFSLAGNLTAEFIFMVAFLAMKSWTLLKHWPFLKSQTPKSSWFAGCQKSDAQEKFYPNNPNEAKWSFYLEMLNYWNLSILHLNKRTRQNPPVIFMSWDRQELPLGPKAPLLRLQFSWVFRRKISTQKRWEYNWLYFVNEKQRSFQHRPIT